MAAPRRPLHHLVSVFTLCCLSAIGLVGCGSSSDTSNSSPTFHSYNSFKAAVPATATACAQVVTIGLPVVGTIQSVSGQTIHITKSSGGSLDATYSQTTHFEQPKVATTSALQPNAIVFIKEQNEQAISIHVQQAEPGQSLSYPSKAPDPSAAAACLEEKPLGNDAPIFGTIVSLTGTTLTVKDTKQQTDTITLTKTTKIIQTTPTTSSAIKSGLNIVAIGPTTNGVMTAIILTLYSASDFPQGLG